MSQSEEDKSDNSTHNLKSKRENEMAVCYFYKNFTQAPLKTQPTLKTRFDLSGLSASESPHVNQYNV
jgi:hypothetical protein